MRTSEGGKQNVCLHNLKHSELPKQSVKEFHVIILVGSVRKATGTHFTPHFPELSLQ